MLHDLLLCNSAETSAAASLARHRRAVLGTAAQRRRSGASQFRLCGFLQAGTARRSYYGGGGFVGAERQIKELEPAAQSLRVKLLYLEGKGEKGLEKAFETAMRERVDAVMPTSGPPAFAERKHIVELAARHRIPAVYPSDEFVEADGLMSYGIDYPDQYRRAAYFVDRILKGTKPADLPVQLPTKFEFIINLKTAKQIDLTISPNVLARADKVIK